MSEERPTGRELFRAALGPQADCPPYQELERLIGDRPGSAALGPLRQHVDSCTYCQTELRLLGDFSRGAVQPSDAAAVRLVTKRLQKRSAEILPRYSGPWWKSLLAPSRSTVPLLAMAGLLLAAGLTFQLRRMRQPDLQPARDAMQDVLRSNNILPVAPVGDIGQAPAELKWQLAPGAREYEVHLMEVDHRELWKARTSETRVQLPPSVQARVVPTKTLLWQVMAFDAAGRAIAESQPVRFRLLQNLHTR
jgi:hypothetical protein